MSIRKDISGQVINKWRVLNYSHTKGKIAYYDCICLGCGKDFKVDGRNIRSERSKSCVVCAKSRTRAANLGSKKSQKTKDLIAEKARGRQVSEETKEKLRGFNIDLCDKELVKIDPTPYEKGRGLRISKKVNEIVQRAKQRGKSMKLLKVEIGQLITSDCVYCNKKPSSYNTIDRIDSSVGYLKDNTVSCCLSCNLAKNTMSIKEFKEWIKRIHSNINNF